MIFWFVDVSDSESEERSSASHECYIWDCVQRARQGDDESFELIVDQYREEMYHMAWRLTRNTEDALDIVQEIFLRAYRALHSFRGKSSFATWLHRIAVTTALDYLRREQRHQRGRVQGSDDADAEMQPDPITTLAVTEATPADHVLKAQVHRALQAAIAELPHRQREVVILRYYHELSLEEIAEVLRCGVGSVKSHLFRAQLRLRILLKDWKPNAP